MPFCTSYCPGIAFWNVWCHFSCSSLFDAATNLVYFIELSLKRNLFYWVGPYQFEEKNQRGLGALMVVKHAKEHQSAAGAYLSTED